MFLLYTLLSSVLPLLLLPLLLLACRKKYRDRLLPRLGIGLTGQLAPLPPRPTGAPTFWIHALSVGEVTSALPLVRGLRETYPEARIVFSATTRSGNEVARQLLARLVDALIPGPLDVGPVVPCFIRTINPDLFILVETDFWPHWLHCLARKQIPLLLVNGRISEKSFGRYQRFAFLFTPMFKTFTALSMQTAVDAEKMVSLGVAADKVVTLGNLKFDTPIGLEPNQAGAANGPSKEGYGFDPTAPLWICGSTHRGEEQPIFQTLLELRRTVPDLQLLIAPRNIERTGEILALGNQYALSCRRWTQAKRERGAILILDTIGELAACYSMAEAVFIGGSLVAAGGHNPIEPAAAGVPVLFGPHMEDFAEIAAELVQGGGARQVESAPSLLPALQSLLTDPARHRAMAEAARDCVTRHQGVVRNHLKTIAGLFSRNTTDG